MIKLDGYKSEIDANTAKLDNFIKHSQETLIDMREVITNMEKNSFKEFQRFEDKLKQLSSILNPLPNKIQKCEALVESADETSVAIKNEMQRIANTNIQMERGKTDFKVF